MSPMRARAPRARDNKMVILERHPLVLAVGGSQIWWFELAGPELAWFFRKSRIVFVKSLLESGDAAVVLKRTRLALYRQN